MTLNELRLKNPGIPIYSVTDPAFEPYGRVLAEIDPSGIHAALGQCPIPPSGNVYVADDAALHAAAGVDVIEKTVFGDMPVQAGYCNGHGCKLNALEYHKCSEVNYSTTGCVLLMALPGDIHGWQLRSESVVGFYLPAGTLVEVHPRVLHFAPCRISPEGFNCLVILENRTNSPLDSVNTAAEGEQRLLWMRNKWLIAHPESVPASKGAFVGIVGENLELKI